MLLDLLFGGFLFSRWLGRRADEKGYPRGDFVFQGLVLYVPFYLAAAVTGVALVGPVGALAGLFGGIVGAGLGAAVINAKPHRPRSEQEEGRSGPASVGAQLVGSTCAGCGKRVASLVGATRCEGCLGAVHKDCAEQHRAQCPSSAVA